MNAEYQKSLRSQIGKVLESVHALHRKVQRLEAQIPEPGWRIRESEETFTNADLIYDEAHHEWRQLVYPGRVGLAIIKTKENR